MEELHKNRPLIGPKFRILLTFPRGRQAVLNYIKVHAYYNWKIRNQA